MFRIILSPEGYGIKYSVTFASTYPAEIASEREYFGVGVGDGFGVGVAVGVVEGEGVGLGVGDGVGLGVGDGVAVGGRGVGVGGLVV